MACVHEIYGRLLVVKGDVAGSFALQISTEILL